MKESGAHTCPKYHFCSRGSTQQEPSPGMHVHRAENGVALLPVEIIRIGKIGDRKQRGAFCYVHKPRGIWVGQGLEQSCIHKSENGNAGANTQGKHENRRQRESWILSHLTE